MCGFAGVLGTSAGSVGMPQSLRYMGSAIKHRGPDAQGIWFDEKAEIGLVHNRLSIVDLSSAGSQPMASARGRYVIAFNGEIYNYRQLKEQLERVGECQWRGHSDTEVLLAAIEHWGLCESLKRCVGMFALALWDRDERTISLARDRIGEKPLYYSKAGGRLLFASELDAITRHPEWTGEIDRGSLALMMRYSYIPAPHTIYTDVHKVRPGEILTTCCRSEKFTRSVFWSAENAADYAMREPFKGTNYDAVDILDGLLRQSIKDQMTADVPLGAFLSGGIDSSVVVALMQSLSSTPIRTFTIGFEAQGYDEARHASSIAEHLGTLHTEMYITGKDALDVVPLLSSIYSEPFSDSSQIPTYLVSRLAKSTVKVSLSGDGGDELFSGYNRYRLVESLWSKIRLLPPRARRLAATLMTAPSPERYDHVFLKLSRLLPTLAGHAQLGDKLHKMAGLLPLEGPDQIYQKLCSHWDPSEIVLEHTNRETAFDLSDTKPRFSNFTKQMMYLDLVSYLPDDILVKLDRASMSVSLETRVPMLDHRIVEFALSLPLSVSRAEGMSKWPLRQLLNQHVPASMSSRPKMGFAVPIGSWLRSELREWAEDLLSEERLRRQALFHPEPIRRAWSEHLSGRKNNQYPLWDVLAFQSWLDTRDTMSKRLLA